MSTPAQIDPSAESSQLANLFYDLSQAVDDYRLADHNPPIPPELLARLKDEAQALDDRAHYFTAEAIGSTLQTIKPNLDKIKTLTAEAKSTVSKLTIVSDVISVATSALTLGTAIAAGNPVSIIAAADGLAKTVAGL